MNSNTLQPRLHKQTSVVFEKFEDALFRAPEVAKLLKKDVAITLEHNGTFRFFGSGSQVFNYKIRNEDT